MFKQFTSNRRGNYALATVRAIVPLVALASAPGIGEELTVTRLDRLGRSTCDVLNIVHECEERDA